jgi:hypothetical protein
MTNFIPSVISLSYIYHLSLTTGSFSVQKFDQLLCIPINHIYMHLNTFYTSLSSSFPLQSNFGKELFVLIASPYLFKCCLRHWQFITTLLRLLLKSITNTLLPFIQMQQGSVDSFPILKLSPTTASMAPFLLIFSLLQTTHSWSTSSSTSWVSFFSRISFLSSYLVSLQVMGSRN